MRYLLVNVLVNSEFGDCSLNGVSNPERGLKLFVPHEHGPFNDESLERMGNAVVLELDSILGSEFFRPRGEKRRVMMGGNFAYCSDSRFEEKYGERPIRIHDRVEV